MSNPEHGWSVLRLGPANFAGFHWEKEVFTAAVADHVQNPRNCGEMADATHYGQCGIPGEGPYVQIWLKIEAGRILKATEAAAAGILTGRGDSWTADRSRRERSGHRRVQAVRGGCERWNGGAARWHGDGHD